MPLWPVYVPDGEVGCREVTLAHFTQPINSWERAHTRGMEAAVLHPVQLGVVDVVGFGARVGEPPRGGGATRGSPPRRRRRLLSSALISPLVGVEAPSLTFAGGGRSMRLRIPAGPSVRVSRGRRAAVYAFTKRSQMCMSHFCSSWDRRMLISSGRLRFVTLTYPKNAADCREVKRHLDVILKRFFRAFGRKGTVWKLEPQSRGAPHLHLLILMDLQSSVQAEIEWWARNWAEVVGSGDPNHLRVHLGLVGNRPCVEVVRDWQSVALYVAKYLGKRCWSSLKSPGRYWGVRHRDLFPVDLVRADVSREQAVVIRRQMRRYLEHQERGQWRVEFDGGRVERPWMSRREAALLVQSCSSLRVRPYHRRIRLRRGGLSSFMSDSDAERLLRWSESEVRSG